MVDAHALQGLLLVVGARGAARHVQRVVELGRGGDREAVSLARNLRPFVERVLRQLRLDLGPG